VRRERQRPRACRDRRRPGSSARLRGRVPPLGCALLLAACSPTDPEEAPVRINDPAPPTARWDQVEQLRAGRDAPRHAGDGGGTVRLVLAEGEEARVPVSTPRTWTLELTVGPEGIAEGGGVYLMPEPFWGWSPPHESGAGRLGFTTASTDAEGVELETSAGGGLFLATVRGRALRPGERVTVVYGAGSGALSDRHAERAARIWLAVDADGDGVRTVLTDSPTVEVLAGPPALLSAAAPAVVRPGERGVLRIAVLDALANRGVQASGTIRIQGVPSDWDLPAEVALPAEAEGVLAVPFRAGASGVVRLDLAFDGTEPPLEVRTAPLLVDAERPRVRWADLHGHSGLSDGTGTPDDWYRYAREVAGLDIAALTDHDHFGVRFLDEPNGLWDELVATAARHHEPGAFVTLPAYEWTSWIHGHRHVLHFAESGPLLSSLAEETERPDQLWDALRGLPAMTLAHHSSGEPIPVNWTFRPDPVLEPLTEIASVHGSSEAADGPQTVRGSRPGRFVRDQLDSGVQLGFVASGDGHDGHPGLAHRSPIYGALGTRRIGTGGLAGLECEDLDRASVLECLRARRTYATNGPRVLLHARLAGEAPGAGLGREAGDTLEVQLHGTAPLTRAVVVRDGALFDLDLGEQAAAGELVGRFALPGGPLAPGDYAYLRVEQADGGCVWSSPWFGAP
jgi:hypothetical protein